MFDHKTLGPVCSDSVKKEGVSTRMETDSRPRRTRWMRLAVIVGLYITASYYVTIFFLIDPGVNQNAYIAMIYQNAHKPFVKETLLPSLIRVIAQHQNPIMNRIANSIAYRFFLRGIYDSLPCYNWKQKYRVEVSLGVIVFFICFIGYGILLQRLVRFFYELPINICATLPLSGLLVLPYFFCYANYMYDPVTLLLYTLAILCMVQGWTLAYLAVFSLASFNKETAILLTGLYFAWEWLTLRRAGVVKMLLVQLGIYVAIQSYIYLTFRGNPGSDLDFHLIDHNLRLITDPLQFLGFYASLVLVALVVGHKWRLKPKFLRTGLVMIIFPLLGAGIFFGYLDELRDYLEAMPLLFLLAVPTVASVFDIRWSNSAKIVAPAMTEKQNDSI